MRIGYTPGQLDAMAEIRAERARLDARAMSRRTLLAASLGFVVGSGSAFFGGDLFFALDGVSEGVGQGDLPKANDPQSPELAWAVGLAREGTDQELARDASGFLLVWRKVSSQNPDLLHGVERIAKLLLRGDGLIAERKGREVARFILDEMVQSKTGSVPSLLSYESSLRGFLR